MSGRPRIRPECRSCKTALDGAEPAEPRRAQVIDVEVIRKVTEWALPGRVCPRCATVTFADPPPGAHAGSVRYGPVLNAAAVVLTAYGNVPPQRAAQVMAMLLGVPVSPGWIDKASARLAAQLGMAGFGAAMLAALAGEKTLAADETPVNVLDTTAPQPAAQDDDEQDPQEKEQPAPGAPHVLIVRTPDGRLTWLQALASRRKGDVAAGIPAAFTGTLMTDGYTGYQHLLNRLAGIQQCCAHVIRRCRAVTKLGPGGLQSWAGDIIAVLREAHQAVEDARARGSTALDAEILDKLRQRYDEAADFGIIHNRLRDWHDGNHPGHALGCWLSSYKEQVFLFPATSPWTGRIMSPSAEPKQPNGTRPSPATGIPSPPSPAGAASAATWTSPSPTASEHSTPSATHSPENPGYRHFSPSADTRSRQISEPREWTPIRKCRRPRRTTASSRDIAATRSRSLRSVTVAGRCLPPRVDRVVDRASGKPQRHECNQCDIPCERCS